MVFLYLLLLPALPGMLHHLDLRACTLHMGMLYLAALSLSYKTEKERWELLIVELKFF